MITHPQITPQQAQAALDTQIEIASFSARGQSPRRLTFSVYGGEFYIFVAGQQVWNDKNMANAVAAYNTFDAATIDYTPENLALAGF
jgi:hypothetical protein